MKLGMTGNGMIVKMALHSLKDTDIEVKALWCRNEAKGRPLTDAFGIEKLYTDYAAFLADDSFDTVYIGLINSLHYAYTKTAILAGKHVIVEKPFTSDDEEAKELIDLAKEHHVMLFEAIMSRYSANYRHIPEILDRIGDLKLIQACYSQYSSRYDSYLQGIVMPAFDPALSGGALYDINVYNVHFVTGLFGAPQSVRYAANKGFNGIDTSGVLTMDYGSFQAVCIGAKDSSGSLFTVLQGTKGSVMIPHRGGHVRDVTLQTKDAQEILDVREEPEPMKDEFFVIRDVIDAGDYEQAEAWMICTLNAMRVLTDARRDANIEFVSNS